MTYVIAYLTFGAVFGYFFGRLIPQIEGVPSRDDVNLGAPLLPQIKAQWSGKDVELRARHFVLNIPFWPVFLLLLAVIVVARLAVVFIMFINHARVLKALWNAIKRLMQWP